jgi:hypothetical protein
MTSIANGESGLSVRTKLNNALARYDQDGFANVSALLADTTLTYSTVVAGDIVRTRAEGFSYQVAASSATNQHITTAGGVKLYFLPFRVSPPDNQNGDVPWLNISAADVSAPKNHAFIRQETADRSDATTVQVQRVVTTDDGHVNPKAFRALTAITGGGGDQIEWAISGEIENSDNTRVAAEGGTAVSGVALKKAANTGVMFGGHFQVKDETGSATVGGIVGVECNIQGNGADTNSNRIGFDLIARTYLSGTAGQFHAGLRVRNSTGESSGRWNNAILIEDGTQSILNGISIATSPGVVGVGIQDEGSKAIGLRLAGSYAGSAIQLSAGQYLAMENTNGIKTAFGVTTSVWGFYNGSNERVGFDMTATPRLRVAGVGVVGQRRTGWTAPTGTATRTAFDTATVTTTQLAERVKGLIDDLITHGLIGA